MKFLCIPCDEAMKLARTAGPDEGSMTVVFRCPACEREVAMLTNAMETQMVRALDVKIGGRSVPAEPMSVVRGALTGSTLTGDARSGENVGGDGGQATHGAAGASAPHGSFAGGITSTGGSKCPFSGAVTAAYDGATVGATTGAAADRSEVRWTAEAEARIERVPTYIRPMVRRGVEDYARSAGRQEVDAAMMDEVRGQFGM